MRNSKNIRSAVLVVSVAVLCAFCPVLYTTAWHLRHGNTVTFAGKIISVPFGWIVDSYDYTAIGITKPPRCLPCGTHPLGTASISKLRYTEGKDEAEIVKNWYRTASGLTQGTNLVLSSRNEDHLTCTQTSLRSRPDWVNLSCLAYPSMLDAEFLGRTKDMDEALAIARSMR